MVSLDIIYGTRFVTFKIMYKIAVGIARGPAGRSTHKFKVVAGYHLI